MDFPIFQLAKFCLEPSRCSRVPGKLKLLGQSQVLEQLRLLGQLRFLGCLKVLGCPMVPAHPSIPWTSHPTIVSSIPWTSHPAIVSFIPWISPCSFMDSDWSWETVGKNKDLSDYFSLLAAPRHIWALPKPRARICLGRDSSELLIQLMDEVH